MEAQPDRRAMAHDSRGRIRQAVVLCGGLGSRLGALTQSCPKPLLEIDGKPFLFRLLSELARHGIPRVTLLASYLSHRILSFAERARTELQLSVDVVIEPERAGTGGALFCAQADLDEWFYLLNGDSWIDINILDLARPAPGEMPFLVRMALRAVPDPGRYDTAELDGDRIVRFGAGAEATGPALINAGVYLVSREVCGRAVERCSFERDVLPRLARDALLAGRAYDRFFIDIGIPADFERAQALVPRQQRRGAVFFDRDGVLNDDLGYVGSLKRFNWLPGARESVKKVNDAGLFAFVVTNQAGVARGYFQEEDVQQLHLSMQASLAEIGAHIDDFRYCPFHPEGTVPAYKRTSEWRKPNPGMVLDLIGRWPVDVSRSILIGDKDTDIEAGEAAGVRSMLVQPGNHLAELIDREIARVVRAGR